MSKLPSLSSVLNAGQRQSLFIGICTFFTAILLLAMVSIVLLIFARGGGYFWPEDIQQLQFVRASDDQPITAYGQYQNQFEQGGEPVRWVVYSHARNPYGNQTLLDDTNLLQARLAPEAARISLRDGRAILGEPLKVTAPSDPDVSLNRLAQRLTQVRQIEQSIAGIRDEQLADIHQKLTELDQRKVGKKAPARLTLNQGFDRWHKRILTLEKQRDAYQLFVRLADQSIVSVALIEVEHLVYPGQLSGWQKLGEALYEVGGFLSESPKQANTAGGVFPALFGTVLMVFLMTIIVTPFGVLAAIYLNEYASNNGLIAVIRIAVSNMAGVPSIVYGVFGLGFFIYGVGGNIDALFFEANLPAPTLGTPGVFWASLTMAILTLPVVIVATEEGLRNVPQGLKAGSYALGATKAETVLYTILPMASPGIMTGVILAIARAAGEVAPLMLVGAVKFAPNLPIDAEFPYLHLERQFMHLGVLIYDGAFHSQTDAKGASMMFAACLLLLVVVFVLNILAVLLRTKLRKRYHKG
ncbi:phosphate ABC transporter permease PstA [Salinimonas sediminis]|uniref:Phosphate transport system permease protein PstA n=1 Tax=Salinimonas sediminis TaxID=2303538 RepID=A0A346NJ13_9ALTE|nr:phosphate ABC transporter permease PstA [Salinimonas sediminis]AXR05520.1 phosphate ABC transporter permease PstA [Salinimonas sediminis]